MTTTNELAQPTKRSTEIHDLNKTVVELGGSVTVLLEQAFKAGHVSADYLRMAKSALIDTYTNLAIAEQYCMTGPAQQQLAGTASQVILDAPVELRTATAEQIDAERQLREDHSEIAVR